MIFLISILIATIFVWATKSILRKKSVVFYIIASVIAVTTLITSYLNIEPTLPEFVRTWVLPIFSKSAFSTALFVFVMYANAVSNTSIIRKTLMPIRAELSIIASILTLGHNAYYGISYFPKLFLNPSSLGSQFLYATITSIVMMIIMLPLFVTSFPSVRKNMNAKTWKSLQKFAYIFYALIYVHVLILNFPSAINGDLTSQINIIIYSFIFISYAILRVNKALKHRDKALHSAITTVGALSIISISALVLTPNSTTVTEIPEPTPVQYMDGVFSGKGMGYNDYIYLDVTILDNKITAIEVTKHSEETPYLRRSEVLFETMISEQITQIDTVTGATFSSLGLIEGVEDALSKAIKKS